VTNETTFNIVTNGTNQTTLNIVRNGVTTTLNSISKLTLTHSNNKGRGKGAKLNVTIKSPIVQDGVPKFRPETYSLPQDLDAVLALAEFWGTHVKHVSSKPEATTVTTEDAAVVEDEIEIEVSSV
jgi:hypothetical protein